MKTTKPPIVNDAWYSASQAANLLGMERTTFWRKANAGWFTRKQRKIDGKWYYEGYSLLKAWRLNR